MKQRAATIIYCLLLYFSGFAQTPTADFKADKTGGCSPIVVNFQDLSTGNPTGWTWDFGNGATSTRRNPSTTYFNPGTYTVSLTATNANGSGTTTKTAFITVYPEPVAGFTADRTTGCTPQKIRFTSTSVTPAGTSIVTYKWDFGDGSTSAEKNPEYVYPIPGEYTVTLTVTNDQGCTELITKPNYINIIAGVAPGFTNTQPAVCSAPATVSFNNSSNGPGDISYYWNFGNGQTSTEVNPSNLYMANGTYEVSLAITSSLGCTDTAKSKVQIGRYKTHFSFPDKICANSLVQFKDSSSERSVSRYWEFEGVVTDTARNTLYLFPTGGTYKVKMTNNYSDCSDSAIRMVTVIAQPVINFSAAETFKCQPSLTTNFTNQTNDGVAYVWDFGDSTALSTDANPRHTYTEFGSYDVTLVATASTGCRDTLTKTAFINIRKPVITFPGLPQEGCVPYAINFSANINTPDQVTSYRWNLGDGSALAQTPTIAHTYTQQGVYPVSLTITTSTGCTETNTLQSAVRVGTIPTPAFTSDKTENCASPGIKFINQSTNATDYLWEFGDGTTSIETNPQHTFSQIGLMDVSLTAINNGCRRKITKDEYATIIGPVSGYEANVLDCNNRLQYTFIDKSIEAQTWEWKVDGVVISNSQVPPAHTFPGLGTYRVALTTTNANGCSYTTERAIRLIDKTPTFALTAQTGCKPLYVATIPSSPDPGSIREYIWTFSDRPAISSNWNVGVSFPQAGNFTVMVTTVDTFGCQDVNPVPQQIRVNGPEADFAALNGSGCKGFTASFADRSTTDGINPLRSWKWDFGDSTIQTFTAPPFEHRYDSTATYHVKLTVTDAAGCTDSVTRADFVTASVIKAAWHVETATCPNAPLTFYDQTPDENHTSFWSFGDGTTADLPILPHAYKDTGRYTVQLKVRDQYGCEDSLIRENHVYVGLPKASFTANNLATYCTPFEARFTNTSQYYNSAFWDLGTATSRQQNPINYYTATGAYPIKLVVTSPGGCQDSITQTLTVYNPNDGKLNYGPLIGCRPMEVNLDAFTEMTASFVWDFGDGNVVDTSSNKITHVYDNLGSFVPKIILTQPEGCVVPLTGLDTIEILGVKTKFTIDNQFFCDSGYVTFSDSTVSRDPIQNYLWNFGDGQTSTLRTPPPHYYDNPGLYTVSLTVHTQNDYLAEGCADTMVLQAPVKVGQSPRIRIAGDSVICLNDFIRHAGIYELEDTARVKWQWYFPNGNTAAIQTPTRQQYKQDGNFAVIAIATNSDGCADTAAQQITVHPLPKVTAPGSITLQAGFPVTIPATYSDGVVGYSWWPATGLSCTDCPQPVAGPKFDTRYSITAIDSNSCKDSTQVQVFVVCKNSNVFVPNTFSPNGDGSNDVFYVRGKGLDRVKSLRIFNRWGEVVFEKRDFAVNDPSVGWNGKYNGHQPHPDVYIYQVEVFCENSVVIRFEGNITLIQ